MDTTRSQGAPSGQCALRTAAPNAISCRIVCACSVGWTHMRTHEHTDTTHTNRRVDTRTETHTQAHVRTYTHTFNTYAAYDGRNFKTSPRGEPPLSTHVKTISADESSITWGWAKSDLASSPIQSNPIQSNPIQSDPIQENTIQSNPTCV